MGGLILPDLRHSTALQDPARWKRIVIDGSLANNGMVGFASVITPELAETVRAYVVARANDEIAPPPPAAATPPKTAAVGGKQGASTKPAPAVKPNAPPVTKPPAKKDKPADPAKP